MAKATTTDKAKTTEAKKHGFSFEFIIVENGEIKKTEKVSVYNEPDEGKALAKAVEKLDGKDWRYTQKFKKF